MTGKISDLTDHLFAQIENLRGAKSAKEIEAEVARTNAIVAVAEQITEGAADQADLKADFSRSYGADYFEGFVIGWGGPFSDRLRAG